MVKEIYSCKSVTLIIHDKELELWYLGSKYYFEYKGDIVDTLAHGLNSIKNNRYEIHKGLTTIINIMEPAQNKNIKFDGTKYIVV